METLFVVNNRSIGVVNDNSIYSLEDVTIGGDD